MTSIFKWVFVLVLTFVFFAFFEWLTNGDKDKVYQIMSIGAFIGAMRARLDQ